MATNKKRINISVSSVVEEAVATLAKRDNVTQATKVSQLLQLALEIEEDMYFSRIVDERMAKKSAVVTHNDAWA